MVFNPVIINYELDGLIQYYVTFSDLFGPLDFYWSGEPPGTDYRYKFLVGCILDSIQYGNPVSVGQETSSTINKFHLSQNYPNPFNPTTSMQYTISSRQFVTLKVYDLLGREVATLVNEEKPAGEYEVEFDISNLSGGISAKGGYASGVYFYQLKAGEFTQTKKMVLMK